MNSHKKSRLTAATTTWEGLVNKSNIQRRLEKGGTRFSVRIKTSSKLTEDDKKNLSVEVVKIGIPSKGLLNSKGSYQFNKSCKSLKEAIILRDKLRRLIDENQKEIKTKQTEYKCSHKGCVYKSRQRSHVTRHANIHLSTPNEKY